MPYFAAFNKPFETKLTVQIITAAISAVINPSMLNPSIKLATNHKIKALKIKVENPRVTMVTGSVNSIKIGRTIAFKIPKIAATIKAV